MAGEEKSKLIPFSKELEAIIEADARRCRRSFVRQVEAVLMTYYGIEDVEVDRKRLEIIGRVAPVSNEKMPLIKADISGGEQTAKKKKKKRA